MKVILEFEVPGEQYELDCAQKGMAYKHAVQEYDQELRSIVKYGGEEYSEDYTKAVAEMRKKLHDIFLSEGLSIHD
jgi:hypothetical protein